MVHNRRFDDDHGNQFSEVLIRIIIKNHFFKVK